MRFATWNEFTAAFKAYLSDTEELFTTQNIPDFSLFHLEQFLEYRATAASSGGRFFTPQVEMLMALAHFLNTNIDMDISVIPEHVILNMKTLIAHKWLQIHSSSPIHDYMDVEQQQVELYLEAEAAEIAYLVEQIM
jgi:hypothetical protein